MLCLMQKSLNINTTTGKKVTRTTLIGIMGSTGNSTGKHLHFEIRNASNKYADTINPAEYMGIPNKLGNYNSANYQIQDTQPDLQCNAHIQDIGWTGYKDTAKEMIGTEGQEKRLEAIQFKASNGLEIQYRVHVQNIGWQDWKNVEEVAGTEGQGLAIEAIEIKSNKDLEVQEHIQFVGWMPKSKGKEIHLGTEGKTLRLEAFRINIV